MPQLSALLGIALVKTLQTHRNIIIIHSGVIFGSRTWVRPYMHCTYTPQPYTLGCKYGWCICAVSHIVHRTHLLKILSIDARIPLNCGAVSPRYEHSIDEISNNPDNMGIRTCKVNQMSNYSGRRHDGAMISIYVFGSHWFCWMSDVRVCVF